MQIGECAIGSTNRHMCDREREHANTEQYGKSTENAIRGGE